MEEVKQTNDLQDTDQEAALQETKQDVNQQETGSRWVLPFFVFLFLQTINFFSFLAIPSGTFGTLIKIEALIVCFYVWLNKRYVMEICSESLSGKFILLFCACSFVSIIPCYLYHGQSITESIKVILPFQLLLFYFIFYINDISEEKIVKCFIAFALIKFSILFFQQFTYPDYWFNAYKEGDISNYGVAYKVAIRSGLYRYLLGMIFLFYFVGLILTYRYLNSDNKIKHVILFALILGGIYLEQFRYNMFCFLLCWIWLNFNGKKIRISVFHIAIVFLLLYILYSNFDLLFGDLKDKTQEDLSDDYVRVLAYTFYLLDYWKGPMTILMGNGYPGTSSYGQEIAYYQEEFTMFRADIGIVGALNTFGVLLIMIFIFYVVRICRNWKYIPSQYQAFLLWLLLMLPLYFTIHYSADISLFMAAFMYLVDKSVNNDKLQLAQQDEGIGEDISE